MASTLTDALKIADDTAAYAQSVRRFHAQQTSPGAPQRDQDIQIALDRINSAMQPLRSEIGRFPFYPDEESYAERRASVREKSDALQRERRKLWKMQHRKQRNRKRIDAKG